MKVLIFEYATVMGLEDPEFLFEGRAMLEGLLDDFNKIEHSIKHSIGLSRTFEVSYLIAEKLLKNEYLQKWDACDPLTVNFNPKNCSDLENWLESNISNFEACIFVAAEEDMELYKLTKIIENNGVTVLGSTSDAVLKCSDKLETYEHLKKIQNQINKNYKNTNININLINTYKIDLDEFRNELKEKNHLKSSNKILYKLSDKFSNLFYNNKKMIIKPADGVACQGIKVLNSIEELYESLKSMETSLPHVLLQDFVEGQACSVSLLSNGINAVPISLNLQKIEFDDGELEYSGGKVPWDHPLKYEALGIAKNIVESIDGLKGYVGVDLILSDKIYFIEINSRLTTPYVALRNLMDINLGLAIADSARGNLPSDLNLSGCSEFQKGAEKLDIIIKN
ncbi:MAG: ATP-grasp domain-containing protein [Methanobacteriaceae archaeon]|nr:ATP-grasp domain-containing protein [Methanobacteriaceae archaeon]MDO9626895.1 ATP-grasp domain-containing protein [Methanobacteriaceae archaeon]